MTLKHPHSVRVQTNIDTPSHRKPQLPHSHPPRHSLWSSTTTDRKYNAVMFGVSKSPPGTPCPTRNHHDYAETSSVLLKLYEDSNPECSIRDCQRQRIGRYSDNSTRPRPLLATLGTTVETRYVLTHYSSLSSSIKPDRSSKKDEKILLSERRKLIEAGSDCRSIN